MTKNFISNRISLSKKYRPYISAFLSKIGKTPIHLLDLQFIHEIKNDFNDIEKEIYEEIIYKVNDKNLEIFSIYIPNELIYDNPSEILNIIEKIDKKENSLMNIFYLILYFYQYEHEAKYLWNQKDGLFSKIKSSETIIQNMQNYISKINSPNYKFQIDICSKYLDDFNGIIDCYNQDNKEILEFKFVKTTSLIHQLQVFLYNFIKNQNIQNLENMCVINFYEGIKYNIKLKNTNKVDSFDLLLKLAKVLNTKIKNLVIMYDLETTGLINDDKYPEIIDRYFYDIKLNSVIDQGLIKPHKKLSEEVSKLTNITHEMLEKEGDEFDLFKNKFIELNSYFDNPTYIAHNGNHFDHKIMNYYDLLDYSKVRFLDSRQIIINFTKNSKKEAKGKLSEMYETVLNKKPLIAHRAQADVSMVIEILNELNIIQKMKL
jgi:hypothetical protein